MRGILIGVVLSLFLLPVSAYAQDYYVDATSGDDDNLGTSPSGAWKTISNVNDMSFNPGDNILFKGGEEWREKLVVPSPGSAGNPITFASYGTGNKPKILGSVAKNSESDWTNEGGNLWYASSATEIWGIVFDNEGEKSTVVEDKADLDTQGESWWDSANSRIYIYSTSNPAAYYNGWIECQKYDWYIIDLNDKSYITIDGLDLRYVGKSAIWGYSTTAKSNIIIRDNTIKYVGNNRAKWPGGRFFGRAIITRKATDVTIDNNNISHIAAGFNHFGDGTSTLVFTITNNIISDLHGYAGNVDGIGFGSPRTDYEGTVISNNNISGFGDEGVDLYFAKNVIVRDNVIHDSATLDGSGSEAGIKAGGMYYAEYGLSEGHQFLRNHVYNCKYGVLSNSGANVIFAYNVIHDISSHGIWVYSKGVNGENDNWKIYNNVVKAGDRAIYAKSGTDGDEMSIAIRNNIADGTNYDIYLNKYVDCMGGYNCLLNDASVRKGTGSIYNGSTYDLYQTDPLFVDAANGNFHLHSISPCIDAGIDVGLTLDFEGNPVPQGNAPDIGAYEYAGEKIECYQGSDCGTDPCKTYTCSNPGTPSAYCSSQDITSCMNDDGCCPTGCTEQNDNDCGGLVGLYHFDEGSGTFASDSSGNANDGTIHGAIWTGGISGKALEFDGVGDYIDCGNDSSLDITGPITIETWIKPAMVHETGPNLGVMAKARSGIDWAWQLRFGNNAANDTLGFQFNTESGSKWVNLNQNLPVGQWHHVVGVFNGTHSMIYLNGLLKDINTFNSIVSSNADLLIGEEGWNLYFNGTIDEVKIYNRALTPGEVLEHYNEGKEHGMADLDKDGYVDTVDLIMVATHFGQTQSHQDWNATANVIPDSEIDVYDVVFIASRFS